MTGRIIDADMDQRASIDRLTAQVETLKWERDMAIEGQRIAREQVQRLQESLTACEQQRDDFKRIVEVWRRRHGGAEDRVRVLETALRKISTSMIEAAALITGEHDAPPAETPAPTYKHGIVEIGACLSCIERDRLRAELAAEKKRAADWKQQACREQDAHAATTAKLGRAVAFLMKRNYSSPTNNHESFDWYRERDAILADADGKVKP
jgi:CRISPR/Cas system-associated endoribonuclease Cas2